MDPFEEYLPELESAMQSVVATRSGGPDLIVGMMRYHLGWADEAFRPVKQNAGKRIRPVLMLLALQAQGGQWRQGLPAAAALELLHNFTLVHDDIEDEDRLRRGRPTLWSLWGKPQAINAGDAMFALSYRALLSLSERGVAETTVVHAAKCYTETVLRITEGQCRDLAFESSRDVTEEAYLSMVGGKTAALLGISAELGGIVAGADPSRCAALREFGESLGYAFQMHDDILGLWGDPSVTGKPVGSDLARRKKTLPILHGIGISPSLRDRLGRYPLSDAEIKDAQAELEQLGSRRYTDAKAREYHDQAMAALELSGGTGPAQVALSRLSERLLGREA